MMSKLMLSCIKATEMVEKRSFSELSCSENMQLKFHTMMCSACRSYQNQSQLLDKIIRQTIHEDMPIKTDSAANSDDLKRNIIAKLG
jgi:hypothetical protein